MFEKKNDVYVFIDAANLWEAQKAKKKMLDLEKLKEYILTKFSGTSIQIYYYDAYPAPGTRDYDLAPKHKFYVFLNKHLGFIVRKKPLKQITVLTPKGPAIQEKGNMDVEIAIDVVDLSKKIDTAVFFTGDCDFLALVVFLRNLKKKVFIFSTKKNISSELRTGGNGYFDILKIQDDIWRSDIRHRSTN